MIVLIIAGDCKELFRNINETFRNIGDSRQAAGGPLPLVCNAGLALLQRSAIAWPNPADGPAKRERTGQSRMLWNNRDAEPIRWHDGVRAISDWFTHAATTEGESQTADELRADDDTGADRTLSHPFESEFVFAHHAGAHEAPAPFVPAEPDSSPLQAPAGDDPGPSFFNDFLSAIEPPLA
jgi:hypothetical protein